MTKYIRTKEGKIFDLKSKEISSIEYIDKNTAINEYKVECAFYTIYYYNGLKGPYLECDNKGGYSCDFIEEKDILKQSEDLAELCDEFVAIEKEYNHLFYGNDIKQIFEYYQEYKEDYGIEKIYGAIWTSKGLIYVAKMDSEGKLVLI